MSTTTQACQRGHSRAEYGAITPAGRWRCRECHRLHAAAARAKYRQEHPRSVPTPAPLPTLPDGTLDRQRLVEQNTQLVHWLVAQTLPRLPSHVDRGPLVSGGYLALVQSAGDFDPTYGVPFTKYASIRIRGAVIDELRGADWASREVRRRSRIRESAEEELTHTFERPPTAPELARHLDIPEHQLEADLNELHRVGKVLSLQGFAEGVDPSAFLDRCEPSPEDLILRREQIGYLLDAVAELPVVMRTVVRRYCFEEAPMADLAAQLAISESRVSQIYNEALVYLREALDAAFDPARLPILERPAWLPGGCAGRRRDTYYRAVEDRSNYRSRIDAGRVAIA